VRLHRMTGGQRAAIRRPTPRAEPVQSRSSRARVTSAQVDLAMHRPWRHSGLRPHVRLSDRLDREAGSAPAPSGTYPKERRIREKPTKPRPTTSDSRAPRLRRTR
jgi:hypothetical protein